MAVSHVKSLTIADVTGTFTGFGTDGITKTIAATDVWRPSNWNSAHNQFYTLVGNTAGASTVSGTNVVLSGGNNVTLSVNGSTIGISGPNLPSTAGLISAINVSAGTTSNNLSAFTLSNSNGLAFGLNGSVITGSYTVPSQTNQSLGLYALGNTTGQSSSSTFDARTISINGAGIASVGYSNGSVIVSVPAGGGGGDGVNIIAAGTQTANTTGTVLFSNANNFTFGMSNNSVVTLSYQPFLHSIHIPNIGSQQATQAGQNVLHLAYFNGDANYSFDRIHIPLTVSQSTSSNSSYSIAVDFRVGIYTRTGSTFNLYYSTSNSIAWSITSNNTTSNQAGYRVASIGFSTTMPEADYWYAILSSTRTTNANWATVSQWALAPGITNSGLFGQASSANRQIHYGAGVLATTTTALPASIDFSAINGVGNVQSRPIFVTFQNGPSL